jgi:hypothetical protein
VRIIPADLRARPLGYVRVPFCRRVIMNRFWQALGAIILALLPACSDDPHDPVDVEVARMLPPAADLPVELLPGSDAMTAKASLTPQSSSDEVLDYPWTDVRDTDFGAAMVGIEDASGEGYEVKLAMYDLETSDAATRFWSENPPEVAHRHRATNIADLPDQMIEEELPNWSVDGPAGSSLEWRSICLAGVRERCHGVYAWTHFCEFALETIVATTFPVDAARGELDDFLLALVDQTMTTTGCPDTP